MYIKTMKEAEDLVYSSYLKAIDNIHEEEDAKVKNPELTRELLNLLDSPDKGQKYIIVTGSKGKGSTSRFISSILGHLGYKVGLFTSPHLVDFNERIRINGKAISNEDFIRISNEVFEPFKKIQSKLPLDQYQGPIGISLAIATLYFREQNTDINVIECGRGGKFDDTNILSNEWAVITPIMEEHLSNLGPSIDNIISHKLGIVKSSTKKVYIGEQFGTLPKIKEILEQLSADKSIYGEDFNAENISINNKGTLFDVKTANESYMNLQTPIIGRFQAVNAAIAIKICEDINNGPIEYTTLKNCFENLQWPGRCEIVENNPTVILDGAINNQSALYIREVIKKLEAKEVISIVGVPKDKDYKGVIQVVSEFSKKIIITKPDISHLSFPEDARNFAATLVKDTEETNLLIEAIALARESESADTILIIGTQTLIANAKRIWKKSLLDIGK